MSEGFEEFVEQEIKSIIKDTEADFFSHSFGHCGDDCFYCKMFGKETKG